MVISLYKLLPNDHRKFPGVYSRTILMALLLMTVSGSLCPRSPWCTFGSPSLWERMTVCSVSLESPVFHEAEPSDKHETNDHHHNQHPSPHQHNILGEFSILLQSLHGQEHLSLSLLGALREKRQFPDHPMILHFAGDHGVGKTNTARLVSKAWSLRCQEELPWLRKGIDMIKRSRRSCLSGDAMLTVSGTSYEGLSTDWVVLDMLQRMQEHHRRFPHGIILLDDASALPANVLSRVLFTYSSTLQSLLVIVTTDFGSQGRTVGKDQQAVAQFARMEWEQFFSSDSGKDPIPLVHGNLVRTFPFVSLTNENVRRVVVDYVAGLSCLDPLRVLSASITTEAVESIVQEWLPSAVENGHALVRILKDWVDTELTLLFVQQGADQRGHIVLKKRVDQKRLMCQLLTDNERDDLEL